MINIYPPTVRHNRGTDTYINQFSHHLQLCLSQLPRVTVFLSRDSMHNRLRDNRRTDRKTRIDLNSFAFSTEMKAGFLYLFQN